MSNTEDSRSQVASNLQGNAPGPSSTPTPANAPRPSSILNVSSSPQISGPGIPSVVAPSSPNTALSSSQPISPTHPVHPALEASSRPALGTIALPASPAPVRAVSYDERAQGHAPFAPGHPPPARAISYDEKVHTDDGEVASLGRNGELRRKVTPLPALPTRGSPVIHGSPDEEYRLSAAHDLGRMNTVNSHRGSNIDWIVPKDVAYRPKTVGERLDPTLNNATEAKLKYASKAKLTGFALNIAIGLQVLLGALTTGISAATTGHNTSIGISILGGLSTLVASYLARARGSNEPELSITRVKDLEQFIRECEAFKMDHGHETGHEYDPQMNRFRERFEELLGNANGERKLSPPV